MRLSVEDGLFPLASWSDPGHPQTARSHALGDLIFQLDAQERPLSGWLSSISLPHERRLVRVSIAGRADVEQRAALFRTIMPSQVDGDPFHGFSILLPPAADEIRLTDVQSGQVLHVSRRR